MSAVNWKLPSDFWEKLKRRKYFPITYAKRVRYHARRNSAFLSSKRVQDILIWVVRNITEDVEYCLILCQAIKYGVRFHSRRLLCRTQNLSLFEKAVNANQGKADILSELTFALGYFLQTEAFFLKNETVKNCITTINSNVKSEASCNFLSQVVASHSARNDSLSVVPRVNSNNDIFQQTQASTADLTTTKELSKLQTKLSTSQKQAFDVPNLSKAFKKTQNVLSQDAHVCTPAGMEDCGGHNRFLLRTPLKEINNYLSILKRKENLTTNDIQYLVGKYFGEFFRDKSKALIRIAHAFFLQSSNTNMLCDEAQQKLFASLDPNNEIIEQYITDNQISKETMAEVRLWAMQAIYNCCVSNVASLDSDRLNIITQYTKPNSTYSLLDKWAWRIVLLQRRNMDDKNLFLDALKGLMQIENKNHLEYLLYIQTCLLNDRCKQLFTSDVLEQLANSFVTISQQLKTLCAEIIADVLEQHESLGLTDSALKNYWIFLKDSTISHRLQLEIVRGIVLTFENRKEIPYEDKFLENLLKNFHTFHSDSSCLILLGLCNLEFTGNRVAEFGELASWLTSDFVAVQDRGSLKFESYTGISDLEGLKFVSTAAGSILLKLLQQNSVQIEINSEVVKKFIRALQSNRDAQTRIIVAECIYRLINFEKSAWLDIMNLIEMENYVNDGIAEVQGFMKLSFARGCWLVSTKYPQTHLPSDTISSLLEIFCDDCMLFSNDKYPKLLNSDVLLTVYNEAQKVGEDGKKRNLNDRSIIAITGIIANTSDEDHRKKCLEILALFLKARDSSNSVKLPKPTIEVLEGLIDPVDFDDLIWSILSCVIQNEQAVAEPTLNMIRSELQRSEDAAVRSAAFRLLEQANWNQDLPDQFFVLFEMENTTHIYENHSNGLSYLEDQVKMGYKLSENIFDFLKVCVQDDNEDSSEVLLNIFSLAAENHQAFPPKLLDILVETFEAIEIQHIAKIVRYSTLFRRIQQNSQELPNQIWEIYENKLQTHVDAGVIEELLFAFLGGFQLRNCIECNIGLRTRILKRFNEIGFLSQESVQCVVEMMVVTSDIENTELCYFKNILTRALENQNRTLAHQAVKGFMALMELNMAYLTDEDIALLLEYCKSCCDAKMLKAITSRLSGVASFDEDQQNLLKLVNPLEPEANFIAALGQMNLDKIPKPALNRLHQMINQELSPDMLTSTLTAILNLKLELPEWLIGEFVSHCIRFNDATIKKLVSEIVRGYAERHRTINTYILTICFENHPDFEQSVLLLDSNFLDREAGGIVNICKLLKRSYLEEGDLEVLKNGLDYQIKNSINIIDESLVPKLLQLSENVPSTHTILEILAKMYMQGYVVKEYKPRLMTMICSYITQPTLERCPAEIILTTFRSLLAQRMFHNSDDQLTKLVRSLHNLMNLYPATRNSPALGLFECLVDVFEVIPNAEPITELYSIANCLNSSDSLFRTLSFQLLMSISNKHTLKSTQFLKSCALLYEKLLNGVPSSKKRFNYDDLRLIGTVISLVHVDKGLLCTLPQEKWIPSLILSSIVEHFELNQIQMAEVKLLWDRLQCKITEERRSSTSTNTNSFQISRRLHYLVDRYHCSSDQFMASLIYLTECESEHVEDTILFGGENWHETIKVQLTHKRLKTKLSENNLSPKFTNRLATRIAKLFSYAEIERLISRLVLPSSISAFDSITKICETHRIAEPTKCVEVILFSMEELKIGLELKILLEMFPLGCQFQTRKLKLNLSSLLKLGYSFSGLHKMIMDLQDTNDVTVQNLLAGVINTLADYSISSDYFEEILGIVKSKRRNEWISSLNEIVLRPILPRRSGTLKTLPEVLTEAKQLNPALENWMTERNIQEKVNRIFNVPTKTSKTITIANLLPVKPDVGTADSILPDKSDEATTTDLHASKQREVLFADSDRNIFADLLSGKSENTTADLLAKKSNPTLASKLRLQKSEEDSIANWVKSIKVNSHKSESYVVDCMRFIQTALRITCRFKLSSIQILSTVVSYEASERQKNIGHLQQVATGSGKSAIIASLAILHALRGKKVDIITSSPVLARRDAKKFTRLFSLFGLRASVNTENSAYTRGPKACYDADIVYGDVSNFQFDILLDEYSLLETLSHRGKKELVALVDEADSLLIDSNGKVARLSSHMPGFDLLQVIYHLLWNELTSITQRLIHWNSFTGKSTEQVTFVISGKVRQVQGRYEVKVVDESSGKIWKVIDLEALLCGEVDREICTVEMVRGPLETYLKAYLTSYISDKRDILRVPIHLKAFVDDQVGTWVENVMAAKSYKENVQYVVHAGEIRPVNYDSSGLVDLSTSWSGGLHQFLQIKHNLRVTPENLTSNFLSNSDFFKRYGSQLYGFTGTLGSQAAKSMLTEHFNVDFCYIPDGYLPKYYTLPPLIVSSHDEWIRSVTESARVEISKKRGVLIICETIEIARHVIQELIIERVCRPSAIKEYTQNGINQEKLVERISPGEIIVATNLAGRGTDIRADELERFGGLHVMLTFLPRNRRVELQNIGRTARQGMSGTSQLLLFNELGNTPNQIFEQRSKEESILLNGLKFDAWNTESKLFRKFCTLLKDLRTEIRKKERNLARNIQEMTFGQFSTSWENAVVSSVEEEWAILMNRIKNGKVPMNLAEAEYERLEKNIRDNFNSDSVIKNPFHFIILADELFLNASIINSKLSQAKNYYEKAIEMDKYCAVAARVGIGNCLLKAQELDHKEKSIIQYTEALRELSTALAQLQVLYALLINRSESSQSSELAKQLLLKQEILTTYMDDIRQRVRTIENSLRLISLRCSSEDETREFIKLNSTACSKLLTEYELQAPGYSNFEIEFNSMTVSQDAGDKDQALITLKNSAKHLPQVIQYQLRCRDVPAGNLSHLFNPKVSHVGQTEKKVLDIPNSNSLKPSTLVLPAVRSRLEFQKASFRIAISSLKPDIAIELIQKSACQVVTLDVIGSSDYMKLSTTIQKYYEKPVQLVRNKNGENMFTYTCVQENDLLNHQDVIFIKIFNLNQSEAEEVCKSNSTCRISLELSLDHLAACAFVETLSDDLSISLTVTMLELDEVKNMVSNLRKSEIVFSMIFQNLDTNAVQEVLKGASIEQETIQLYQTESLSQTYSSRFIPTEVKEFEVRGISLLIQLNEKQPIPWKSISILTTIALLQMSFGGVLIYSGFGAKLGVAALTEGSADLFLAYRAYVNREFNWTAYAQQKSVSLIISATTVGWTGIKDAGKGIQTLLKASISETVETIGKQALTNYSQSVFVETGRNVNTMAMNQIGWCIGSMAAREAGFEMVDRVTSWGSKNLLVPHILKEVECKILNEFQTNPLRFLASKITVLDCIVNEHSLQAQCEKIINNLLNRTPDFLDQAISALIEGVSKIVFQKLDFYEGSPSVSDLLSKFQKILTATNSISRVVCCVCKELSMKLDVHNREILSNAYILEKYCSLNPTEAATIGRSIEAFDWVLQAPERAIAIGGQDISEEKKLQVYNFVKNLKMNFEAIKISDSNLSMTMKSISMRVTEEILSTIDRKLISPSNGIFVNANLESPDLQQYASENLRRINSEFAPNQKKLPSLSPTEEGREMPSTSDNEFLKLQRRIIRMRHPMKNNSQETYSEDKTEDKKLYLMLKHAENYSIQTIVEQFSKSILCSDKPPFLTELSCLAEMCNIDLNSTDLTKCPSALKIREGTTIFFSSGEADKCVKNGFGHFKLMKADTTFEEFPRSSMYDLFEEMTGFSEEDLRCIVCIAAGEDPAQFVEYLGAELWICSRTPIKANAFLFNDDQDHFE